MNGNIKLLLLLYKAVLYNDPDVFLRLFSASFWGIKFMENNNNNNKYYITFILVSIWVKWSKYWNFWIAHVKQNNDYSTLHIKNPDYWKCITQPIPQTNSKLRLEFKLICICLWNGVIHFQQSGFLMCSAV